MNFARMFAGAIVEDQLGLLLLVDVAVDVQQGHGFHRRADIAEAAAGVHADRPAEGAGDPGQTLQAGKPLLDAVQHELAELGPAPRR